MKRNLLFVSLLAAGLISVTPALAQDQTVKLTTAKAVGATITLQVNQVKGGVTVDWGDGNAVSYPRTSDDLLILTGTLKGSTVTLSASKRLNTLVCSNNELTSIDLSQATQLLSLYCQHNQLTSLDLTGLTQLTDLNCADNQLTALVLTEKNLPALQNLDISNNQLKTNTTSTSSSTFVLRLADLQHLDISGNQFGAMNLTSNTQLDMLNCADNALTNKLNLAMNDSIAVVMAQNNQLQSCAMPSKGATRLRKMLVDTNKLSTLDLENSLALHTLTCSNNELWQINLPAATTLDIMSCGGNKLSFSSLPSAAHKPTHMSYTPQDENLDITAYLKSDDKGYYVQQCPEWASRLKSDYQLNLHDFALDPDGKRTITITWYGRSGEGEVQAMTKASASNTSGDVFATTSNSTYGTYSFMNPFDEAYCTLTCTTYPELEYRSTTFRVKGQNDGISQVTNTASTLHVEARQGLLILSAASNTTAKVYTVSGKLVWQGTVLAGTPVQVQLPAGVYVAGGQKVVL